MSTATPSLTAETLMRTAPVIPVLTINHSEDAIPLAQALVEGGLKVLEVTLRTPTALEAIKAIAQSVPDALIGAGTIRTPAQAQQAMDHGARFLVSPGTTPALIDCFKTLPIPVLPGCATISEAMSLAEAGFNCLKFFPAEAAGGIPYLKSLSGPLPDLRFCPTGGIDLQKAPNWLALPNVLCVGGSWVTPADALKQKDWARIKTLAADACQLGR
jgi:2-dehydro-3-deoxyphosphogluconate aldolase/(4S)-4-hydroxy-2-oxoglutarate aldolase